MSVVPVNANSSANGVVKYIKNAQNFGVLNKINLPPRVGIMNDRDWNIMQLMLVIEPVLSYLIANVIVKGRRIILNSRKTAPGVNNANNKNLIKAANMPLNVINNFSLMNKAIKNINAKNRNAMNNKKTINVIQNAIHMVVFGLIVANGSLEIVNSFMEVSLNINITTSRADFLMVCRNAIMLISRVVLPIILGLINKVFKGSKTGTKAVILSSAAAALVATQMDMKIVTVLTKKINNTQTIFNAVNNKLNIFTKLLKLYDPSIANAQRSALSGAMVATRKTLRSILTVLFSVISSMTMASVKNRQQERITTGSNRLNA